MKPSESKLNPSVSDIEKWLREDEGAQVSRREVADRLGNLTVAGILRGLVEDVGSDEVLFIGAKDGHWPMSLWRHLAKPG